MADTGLVILQTWVHDITLVLRNQRYGGMLQHLFPDTSLWPVLEIFLDIKLYWLNWTAFKSPSRSIYPGSAVHSLCIHRVWLVHIESSSNVPQQVQVTYYISKSAFYRCILSFLESYVFLVQSFDKRYSVVLQYFAFSWILHASLLWFLKKVTTGSAYARL